jgi:putative peptidoglycan lipid II flippase
MVNGFVLMVPVTLGLGLINVNAVIDQVFASRPSTVLAPTAIQKSFLVYMPAGRLRRGDTTVLFPTHASARGDLDGFRHAISAASG